MDLLRTILSFSGVLLLVMTQSRLTNSRPLGCSIVNETIGSIRCCNNPSNKCQIFIPKSSFGLLNNTWPSETIKFAKRFLQISQKNVKSIPTTMEFSSPFVASDFNRRQQIQLSEKPFVEMGLNRFCQEYKKIDVLKNGFSIDGKYYKIHQELPLKAQVVMQKLCLNPTQDMRLKCEQRFTFVPLYAEDEHHNEYLKKVLIRIKNGCLCSTCKQYHRDILDTVRMYFDEKEHYKRVANYASENKSINGERAQNNFSSDMSMKTFLDSYRKAKKELEIKFEKIHENVKDYKGRKEDVRFKQYQDKLRDAIMLLNIASRMMTIKLSASTKVPSIDLVSVKAAPSNLVTTGHLASTDLLTTSSPYFADLSKTEVLIFNNTITTDSLSPDFQTTGSPTYADFAKTDAPIFPDIVTTDAFASSRSAIVDFPSSASLVTTYGPTAVDLTTNGTQTSTAFVTTSTSSFEELVTTGNPSSVSVVTTGSPSSANLLTGAPYSADLTTNYSFTSDAKTTGAHTSVELVRTSVATSTVLATLGAPLTDFPEIDAHSSSDFSAISAISSFDTSATVIHSFSDPSETGTPAFVSVLEVSAPSFAEPSATSAPASTAPSMTSVPSAKHSAIGSSSSVEHSETDPSSSVSPSATDSYFSTDLSATGARYSTDPLVTGAPPSADQNGISSSSTFDPSAIDVSSPALSAISSRTSDDLLATGIFSSASPSATGTPFPMDSPMTVLSSANSSAISSFSTIYTSLTDASFTHSSTIGAHSSDDTSVVPSAISPSSSVYPSVTDSSISIYPSEIGASSPGPKSISFLTSADLLGTGTSSFTDTSATGAPFTTDNSVAAGHPSTDTSVTGSSSVEPSSVSSSDISGNGSLFSDFLATGTSSTDILATGTYSTDPSAIDTPSTIPSVNDAHSSAAPTLIGFASSDDTLATNGPSSSYPFMIGAHSFSDPSTTRAPSSADPSAIGPSSSVDSSVTSTSADPSAISSSSSVDSSVTGGHFFPEPPVTGVQSSAVLSSIVGFPDPSAIGYSSSADLLVTGTSSSASPSSIDSLSSANPSSNNVPPLDPSATGITSSPDTSVTSPIDALSSIDPSENNLSATSTLAINHSAIGFPSFANLLAIGSLSSVDTSSIGSHSSSAPSVNVASPPETSTTAISLSAVSSETGATFPDTSETGSPFFTGPLAIGTHSSADLSETGSPSLSDLSATDVHSSADPSTFITPSSVDPSVTGGLPFHDLSELTSADSSDFSSSSADPPATTRSPPFAYHSITDVSSSQPSEIGSPSSANLLGTGAHSSIYTSVTDTPSSNSSAIGVPFSADPSAIGYSTFVDSSTFSSPSSANPLATGSLVFDLSVNGTASDPSAIVSSSSTDHSTIGSSFSTDSSAIGSSFSTDSSAIGSSFSTDSSAIGSSSSTDSSAIGSSSTDSSAIGSSSTDSSAIGSSSSTDSSAIGSSSSTDSSAIGSSSTDSSAIGSSSSTDSSAIGSSSSTDSSAIGSSSFANLSASDSSSSDNYIFDFNKVTPESAYDLKDNHSGKNIYTEGVSDQCLNISGSICSCSECLSQCVAYNSDNFPHKSNSRVKKQASQIHSKLPTSLQLNLESQTFNFLDLLLRKVDDASDLDNILRQAFQILSVEEKILSLKINSLKSDFSNEHSSMFEKLPENIVLEHLFPFLMKLISMTHDFQNVPQMNNKLDDQTISKLRYDLGMSEPTIILLRNLFKNGHLSCKDMSYRQLGSTLAILRSYADTLDFAVTEIVKVIRETLASVEVAEFIDALIGVLQNGKNPNYYDKLSHKSNYNLYPMEKFLNRNNFCKANERIPPKVQENFEANLIKNETLNKNTSYDPIISFQDSNDKYKSILFENTTETFLKNNEINFHIESRLESEVENTELKDNLKTSMKFESKTGLSTQLNDFNTTEYFLYESEHRETENQMENFYLNMVNGISTIEPSEQNFVSGQGEIFTDVPEKNTKSVIDEKVDGNIVRRENGDNTENMIFSSTDKTDKISTTIPDLENSNTNKSDALRSLNRTFWENECNIQTEKKKCYDGLMRKEGNKDSVGMTENFNRQNALEMGENLSTVEAYENEKSVTAKHVTEEIGTVASTVYEDFVESDTLESSADIDIYEKHTTPMPTNPGMDPLKMELTTYIFNEEATTETTWITSEEIQNDISITYKTESEPSILGPVTSETFKVAETTKSYSRIIMDETKNLKLSTPSKENTETFIPLELGRKEDKQDYELIVSTNSNELLHLYETTPNDNVPGTSTFETPTHLESVNKTLKQDKRIKLDGSPLPFRPVDITVDQVHKFLSRI